MSRDDRCTSLYDHASGMLRCFRGRNHASGLHQSWCEAGSVTWTDDEAYRVRLARDSGLASILLALAVTATTTMAVFMAGVATGTTTVDTIPAPGPTVTATVPGPVRTIEVTRTPRATRSQVARPQRTHTKRPASSARLNLAHAELWDTIAACESGGRWNLNTGPHDGGLQFLPSTWRAWGGADFAPFAWQATRAEQITVANRSGRTDPWLKPWPVCGKRAAAALGVAYP